MVERVERVMRIKRVRFNNDELFERREKDESFSSIFEDEVEKKKKRQMKQEDSETAYHLEIGRATQSLFYQGKADISDAKRKLPHAG